MTEMAWHFVGATLRDGRPIPPDGEWLTHDGSVVICRSGLHASPRLIDALDYAPGGTLCLVECEDVRNRHSDKLVCSRRRIVWRIDASDLLRRFARKCALDVIHLWEVPPVVREYLETGREDIRDAARDAARAASWDAARDAVWDASRDAVWDASRAASWAAAGAASWDAARDAAGAASRAAAWDAASDAASDAARDAAGDAARDAAMDAAGAAASDAQNVWLEAEAHALAG